MRGNNYRRVDVVAHDSAHLDISDSALPHRSVDNDNAGIARTQPSDLRGLGGEFFSDAMKPIAYVVYSPPEKGLPFLAVTMEIDGTTVAKQFETFELAEAHVKEMSKGHLSRGTKH